MWHCDTLWILKNAEIFPIEILKFLEHFDTAVCYQTGSDILEVSTPQCSGFWLAILGNSEVSTFCTSLRTDVIFLKAIQNLQKRRKNREWHKEEETFVVFDSVQRDPVWSNGPQLYSFVLPTAAPSDVEWGKDTRITKNITDSAGLPYCRQQPCSSRYISV